MQHCLYRIAIRMINSWNLHYKRETVPEYVSNVHPRTSMTRVKSHSPAWIFLTLANSVALPVENGKSHLRAWMVSSTTWCCCWGFTCTTVITLSMLCSVKFRDNLLVEADIFHHFSGLILCNTKFPQFQHKTTIT